MNATGTIHRARPHWELIRGYAWGEVRPRSIAPEGGYLIMVELADGRRFWKLRVRPCLEAEVLMRDYLTEPDLFALWFNPQSDFGWNPVP